MTLLQLGLCVFMLFFTISMFWVGLRSKIVKSRAGMRIIRFSTGGAALVLILGVVATNAHLI